MTSFSTWLVNPMEKVFADTCPPVWNPTKIIFLQGERVAFQVVYTVAGSQDNSLWQHLRFHFDGVGDGVRLWDVCLTPVEFPVWTDRDEHYLRTMPGMYPDRLQVSDGTVLPVPDQCRSLWVEIDTAALPSGDYSVCIGAEAEQADGTFRKIESAHSFSFEVLPTMLEPMRLLHTEWFHADCLADYYHVPVFSEQHWMVMKSFIDFAVKECAVNTLLTPVFTPPLDTAVGGERTTVQLVDIYDDSDAFEDYRFDFSKLGRFCQICRQAGITHLEIAHLFTQWGAKFTPKIMIWQHGVLEKRFGWHVSAMDPAYRRFLESFLPALIAALDRFGYDRDHLFFHISDEPHEEVLESYQAARAQVIDLLDGCQMIDALSSYAFYEKGLVPHPVVANDHIEPFLAKKVSGLWTYYCCAQGNMVPNRFMAMPSSRNRVMGLLMAYFQIEGFLHWGYNFYNSRYSLRLLNPYYQTDCDFAFPAGDAYLVYPGENKQPEDSLRNRVQRLAFQDLAVLQQIERLLGRDRWTNVVNRYFPAFSFAHYPHDEESLEIIMQAVKSELKN